MLTITTTNNLDGYEIVEYLGIVTGEAVSGINMFRHGRACRGGRFDRVRDLRGDDHDLRERHRREGAAHRALGADSHAGGRRRPP